MIRSQVGLIPADNKTRDWFGKLKMGSTVIASVTKPRNPAFHRKMFALYQLGYEHWSETAPPVKFKGEEVLPDFERFRKDITIMAGRFHPVVNIKGEVRIEADSISYGSMTEEDFQSLYSQIIEVLLSKVFTSKHWDAEKLKSVVDQIVEFAA